MTTEKELREVLYSFGIGFFLRRNKNFDIIELMPTKRLNVYKIELSTKGHIETITLDELLRACLTKKEFEFWKSGQLTLADKDISRVERNDKP